MSKYAISSNREISGGGSIPALKREISKKKSEIVVLNVQLSSLQFQLDEAIADLAQAQSALAAAQAQIAADAVTIANLQSQVTSLQAQVTALQNQLAAYLKYQTYFAGQVTLVGGGIYVPPSYNNPVILVSNAIIPPRKMGQYTTVGGSFP